MRFLRFLVTAAVAAAVLSSGLASAEAETEAPVVEPTMDCGDNLDLPWRCAIVPADELAPVLTLFEGACFLIDTLEVSPWTAVATKDGGQQVTHFVVAARMAELPCFHDRATADRLSELGLELPAGSSGRSSETSTKPRFFVGTPVRGPD
jgi:hypothetical protein